MLSVSSSGIASRQEAGQKMESAAPGVPAPARTYSPLGLCVVGEAGSVPPGLFLPSHPFLPQGITAFREGIWVAISLVPWS